VAGFVLGHDRPGPGLSTQGLLTIALAALVVVLLTLRRTAGPGPLLRAVAEYAVVAVLAGLLVAGAGVDQPPTGRATPAARAEAKRAPRAKPNVGTDEYRSGVLRVAARVGRAVTRAVRAVTGAAGWLLDLWRQADAKTNHPSRSPFTSKGEAMPDSPAAPSSTRRLL
jgi:hypothetical protein